ncbi:MAG: glycosyltransferase [Verrucomicrobiae bacterium]|nr:glycosyltransferase [Verrucomicrobiae bacterium]
MAHGDSICPVASGSGADAATRVDLHVHSRHSDRPSEWILRRVGAPECYTEPEVIWERARAAGMRFVAVTDHNEVKGALELQARHPGEVIVGEEITTWFPENGCKMHLLAWGLTEALHREIQEVRGDLVELAAWLRAKGILHAVAHPFYQNNARLTLDQFEKLILLFRHFEGLNGSREALLSSLAVDVLRTLTPETIAQLADRHGIAPAVPEPHVKFFTGGSDDHSSVFIARAWTETPAADSPAVFLEHVRNGRCGFGGRAGSPLTLSHGIYNIAYLYYSDKLKRGSRGGNELMVKVFENFVTGQDPTRFSLGERLRYVARKMGRRRRNAREKELSLSAQLSGLFREDAFRRALAGDLSEREEVEVRSFRIASRIVNRLSYTFLRRVIEKAAEGNVVDCLQAASALGPIALGAAPYFVAFKHHSKNRSLMVEAGRRFLGRAPGELARRRRAWFTDTLQDVNGVSHTIEKICGVAAAAGADIEVIVSKSRLAPAAFPLRNFPPMGEFPLKEYAGLEISFPPLLDILEHCWRGEFTEIVASTPGPVGLAGVLAGKLLGLRTAGIYHTDFPQYVRVLTEDEAMGALTGKYMEWFYGLVDTVYVPSEAYRLLLLERGLPAKKLRLMPRGIDCRGFSPEKRDPRFWEMFGAGGGVRFLYVGRISKEKNLDTLAEAWAKLRAELPDASLALVGDGPWRTEMRRRLAGAGAVFTGFLSGEALSRAYASADAFVFPSTTDTFGNVVLEAQASGLPTIVTNVGGPRELVRDGETGLVVPGQDAAALLDAMRRLAADPALRRKMGEAARLSMGRRTWERAFEDFWSLPTGAA